MKDMKKRLLTIVSDRKYAPFLFNTDTNIIFIDDNSNFKIAGHQYNLRISSFPSPSIKA